MKERILVIGATGFIGSNLVRYLLHSKNNYYVIGVDRIKDSKDIHNMYFNKSCDFYIADVNDSHIMGRILEITNPNIIINLVTDYTSVISLCSLIKDKNIKLIQISDASIYNNPEKENFEIDSQKNKSSYIVIEKLIKDNSVPYIIIRKDTIFGPRNKNNNIVNFIYNCLINDFKVSIYNKGEKMRSLTYIEDLNEAIVCLIENNKYNEIYNVSSGFHFTDLEVAFLLKDIFNSNSEITFDDKNICQEYYNLNTNKLRNLGWKPKLPFKDRLKQTIKWYENNKWFNR